MGSAVGAVSSLLRFPVKSMLGERLESAAVTVPRCVMTTLEQGDLPADTGVLRTIAEHNSVDCFGTGTKYPCVGVYANVVEGGTVTVGQPVIVS